MTKLDDFLQIVKRTGGDAAQLALATIDIAYETLPAPDRDSLKRALEAAAIPHWVDDALLAAVLDVSAEESAVLLARLRSLAVVEPFPARGYGAVDVHENSRNAIRQALWRDQPERFIVLSSRARAAVAGNRAAAFKIEALYHLFVTHPDDAVDEWVELDREMVLYQDRHAIAGALGELLDQGWLSGAAKAAAIVARINLVSERGGGTSIEPSAREALALASKAHHLPLTGFAWSLLGEALLARGDVEEAQRAFESQLATFEQLAKEQPQEHGWLRELAFAHANLSSVKLTRGYKDEALGHMKTTLALGQQRLEKNSSSVDNQRTVGLSHARVAIILHELKQFEVALKHSSDATEILSKLADAEPTDPDLQRELAVIHEIRGVSLAELQRLDEALSHHRTGLEIVQRLVSIDTGNAQLLQTLSHAYARIGLIEMKLDHAEAALAAFRKDLQLSTSAVESDPANVEAQHDLAIAYKNIGAALEMQGHHDEARDAFQTAETVMAAALERSPDAAIWRTQLETIRKRIVSLG
jgi:tetratricopeptide (TPR) repeat protein